MKILTEPICNVSHPYLYDNVEIKNICSDNELGILCVYIMFFWCLQVNIWFDEIILNLH